MMASRRNLRWPITIAQPTETREKWKGQGAHSAWDSDYDSAWSISNSAGVKAFLLCPTVDSANAL